MISLGMPISGAFTDSGTTKAHGLPVPSTPGLMFVGPFTVYLGGLIGPRRILLAAAALFTTLLIFLPFAHSYSLVIALVLLWPDFWYVLSAHAYIRPPQHSSSVPSFHTRLVRDLCGWGGEHSAFALRLVQKPSFVELDVLEFGAHHAAHDDCIYYGIPKANVPKKSGEAPGFAGFLYASAGLAMLLLACDKGKARLVAVRSIQRIVRRRGIVPAVRVVS